MVGNDIVDLGDPETQLETRHPRFDGRVFTPGEFRLIDRHEKPNHMRWILWACKESAYKLVKRRFHSTVFSQRAFEVEMVRPKTFLVRHGESVLGIEVSLQREAIHAVATWSGEDCNTVISAIGTTTANPSDAVRKLARERLAEAFFCARSEIEFVSGPARIPLLMVGGNESRSSISFSHHGRFVAFACNLVHCV